MMTNAYNPEETARYFDEVGRDEWERLTASPADEVSLHLHKHYLEKHIRAGMRVLEIGAGPGRFTQTLAELGARVRVADISAGQLALNRRFAAELGFAAPAGSAGGGVEGWDQADISDLSRYSDASFDALVAYGGPLSYVLERRDAALGECLRVLRPGGPLLLSVMSLWGTAHWALKGVLGLPVADNQRITATGDLIPEHLPRRGNAMHLFRSTELRAWLEAAGVEILDLSACFCLSPGWNDSLRELRGDEEKWGELLRMELEASASPGCLDMGTHIIAAVRKA
jgi:SAM-dependent methyltransferase